MVKLQRIRRRERRRTKEALGFDRRPAQNALRFARTNLIAPSRGRKDADHKSGGPRYPLLGTVLPMISQGTVQSSRAIRSYQPFSLSAFVNVVLYGEELAD
jgi:hypothetical protein